MKDVRFYIYLNLIQTHKWDVEFGVIFDGEHEGDETALKKLVNLVTKQPSERVKSLLNY